MAVLYVRVEGFAAAAAHRAAGDGTAAAVPVVVVERGRVRDACPAARRRGVHAGMPAWRARQLCPEAAFREWDPDAAAAASDRWLALCHRLFPRVEPDGPGAALLAPCPLPSAAAAVAALAVESLPSWGHAFAAGAATGRLVARVAARLAARPGRLPPAARPERPGPGARLVVVPPGAEAAFLAPLPLDLLAEEVAPQALEALARAGCRLLGDLQRLGADALAARLGRAEGERLARLARGLDPRPVACAWPPPEVRVRLPLGGAPLGDAALDRCARELARRLLEARQACAHLALEVEPEATVPLRRERRLPRPTLRAEALAAHLRALAADLPPPARSAVAAVTAAALRPAPASGWHQPTLWAGQAARPADRQRRLEATLAAVRARFGHAALHAGAAAPETWRERRLALWDPWRWRV